MGPIIAIGHFPDLDEENEMTELRQRMTDAMVRRGLAERTKESYLAGVTGLAKYDWLSPDTLDAEAIQASRLPLITEKKLAYTSVNPAACAFRFLFATVLGQKSVAFDILMNQVPKRRSQVLTRDEVQRLFVQCGDLRSRAVRMTTYAAGLRLSEVCALPLGDIESAPDQMGIKVRQGKGGQDRYTRLSPRLLDCPGVLAARGSGCSPTAAVTARSSTRPPSACPTRLAAPPVWNTAAVSTLGATPSPLTCSKPASISIPSRA